MAVEEEVLLFDVEGIVGGLEVENDLIGRLRMGSQKQLELPILVGTRRSWVRYNEGSTTRAEGQEERVGGSAVRFTSGANRCLRV